MPAVRNPFQHAAMNPYHCVVPLRSSVPAVSEAAAP